MTLSRSDLEILLGAALFPLKPLLDAEITRMGQSLDHLPKLPALTDPTQEQLRLMVRETESAVYSGASALGDALLEALRDRGFYSLNDLPPNDQEWFECLAVSRLEDLVNTLEREGVPEALRTHYAEESWSEHFQKLGLLSLGKEIESHLIRRAPIRDNFRAGLRAAAGVRRRGKLPKILDAFELKPTFFGFGLNLNFIIERLWARLKRAR